MRAPYYSDPSATLYQGDGLDVLAEMEPESVHCVVTSPPYFGLRKYDGQQERVWGGVANHEHEWNKERRAYEKPFTFPDGAGARKSHDMGYVSQGSDCDCSAWRGSFGLEPLHDCLGWARGDRCNVPAALQQTERGTWGWLARRPCGCNAAASFDTERERNR